MSNKVATTVKVENALYDQFKIFGIRHKLTLQGLVEKTIYRYVNEDAFRNEMNEFVIPVTSGSAT
jgi:predicted DNA-binding ribbon-helix-helix protein